MELHLEHQETQNPRDGAALGGGEEEKEGKAKSHGHEGAVKFDRCGSASSGLAYPRRFGSRGSRVFRRDGPGYVESALKMFGIDIEI